MQEKKKQKIVEDKTFGMKNKNKSKQVQKYVQTVNRQVDHQLGLGEFRGGGKKKKKELDEIDLILQDTKVVATKNPAEKGADPKSIVCDFFKRGLCKRGKACKYSHDLSMERKAAKIDLFTDIRESNDDMSSWDQQKLEDVVNKKHGDENKTNNKTKIVCKHFLEAVESCKYGWFWECPNGGRQCQYVHALPPGYVFKAQKKQEEDEEEQPRIDEIIEDKRTLLTTHTPVTLETFLEWKRKKAEKQAADNQAMAEKRKADLKSEAVRMTGRELFETNQCVFEDDESAAETNDLKREDAVGDDVPFANVLTATATSITRTSLKPKKEEETSEKKKKEEAKVEISGVAVDASLFAADEDLDALLDEED